MNTAIISVGSNIDPERSIARAKELLSIEQHFLSASQFIKTSPLGFVNQPDFFNGAFLVTTDLSIEDFAVYLKALEARLGRVRSENKNGPRCIDLDIVVWNGAIVSDDYYERDFVRNAVSEILKQRKPGT